MHDHPAAETIRLNYRDFQALPDDGRRYEILDGDLHVSPSPQTAHQRVLLRLGRTLADHVERNDLGEVFIAPFDVLLSEHDIVEPDIIYVAKANRDIITDEHIRGVPDLLIEILSPSRPELDTRDKRNLYARCGVPNYWIVDPANRCLIELALVGSAYAVASERTGATDFQPRLLGALKVDLGKLWPD